MTKNIIEYCRAQNSEQYDQIIEQIELLQDDEENLNSYLASISSFLNKDDKQMEFIINKQQQIEVDKTSRQQHDNPITKCQQYMSYIDCTCQIPTYIIQFIELVTQALEKQEGEPRINRHLPITVNDIDQVPISKKKNIVDYPPYSQIDTNSRDASLYKFDTVKKFKQFCQQIYKSKPEEYKHASFTNQDFKYVPSMYKIVYNIDIPKFSEEDIKYISNIYQTYHQIFQTQIRQEENLRNSKKTMVIIQQIIKHIPRLYNLYSPLFVFIQEESPAVKAKNDRIFEKVWQKMIENNLVEI